MVILRNSFGQSQPSNILPFDNEVTIDTTLQFKWTKNYYDSQSYELQVSTDNLFMFLLLDSNIISNNQINLTLPYNTQDYFWRTRWNDGINQGLWSVTSHFKVLNPSQIGGLSVWIDPNQDITLSGQTIMSIADQSGLNNNANQSNFALQPSIVINDSTINYKSLMKYDGVNDFMEIADNNSIDFINEFSIFLLYKPLVIATNKTFLSKWDYPTQGSWAWQTAFNLTDEMLYSPAASLTDATPASVQTSNTDFVLKPTLLGLEFNGLALSNKIQFFKNGNSLLAGNSSTFGSSLPNSAASLKIGRYGGSATRYMDGNIGEFLIYNHVLTVNQKEDIQGYLRYKYSPPISLGNDTIMSGNNLCGTITLSPQKPFLSYLWSTGQTTKTIIITNPGEYWLQTIDFFGFVSRDTIVVFPPYDINIPATDTTVCLGNTINWVTDFPTSNFTFQWQDNSINDTLSINTSGDYFLTISDLFGCSIVSDTMHVNVDQYPANMSLGNDTTLCSSNLIELVSGVAETVSYAWNDNSSLTNLAIYSSGNYWLQSTNSNGCVAQDTINVIVSGTAPTAFFTGQNRCLGVANAFTDGSVGIVGDPVTSWSWDFGDGLGVSSAQNPSYTYTVPGSYTVELYALSQGGCGSYHTVQIEVFAPPVASYTYTGSCSDQLMQFTNQSLVGGAAINQYAWNFGQPSLGAQNVSSVQNPYRFFPTGGTYSMSLTVTDAHLCVDDTVVQILVNASPIIDVFAPDACTGASIQFTNNTVVQMPATYLWNFGDNTTSILPLPNKQYSTEGLKTITVKVTAVNGCFTSDTIQMTVHPVPVASFDLGPHCKGSYTEVQSTSTITTGSIADLFWVVNLTDTLYGDPAGYVITNLNQQQIQLFIESDFGCTDDQNLFFDPEGAITASFTFPSPVAAVGDTVEFTNTSIGATNFTWNFGDGNSLIQENPRHVYATIWEDSTVVVELIVSNALGCIDTAQLTLPIVASFIDLKLNTVFVQQNGSVAILGAQLKNNGNLPITHADLTVYSEDGLIFSESWNGLLVAGDDIIYVLSGQPSYPLLAYDDLNSYYCIQSVGYSGLNVESDLTNNEACKNIESNEVILKPVYPNPTGSTITLGLIVPESADISADLVDDQGRVVKQLIYPFTLASGEYSYVYDLSSIANGTYVLRFTADGKTALHRIVVLK
jgi:PKD repeat protein